MRSHTLPLLALGAALALAPSGAAHGFAHVVPDASSKLRIHGARLVVVTPPRGDDGLDRWTLSLLVSGSGRPVVALPFEPDLEGAPRLDPALHDTLDALDHATAPRFVDLAAWDPCTFGLERFARTYPKSDVHRWPHGARAYPTTWPKVEAPRLEGGVELEVAKLDGPGAIDAWLAREGRTASPEARAAWAGRALAALRLRPRTEPRWTPPLYVRRTPGARAALAVDALAEAAPPGRLQRIDLFTLAPGGGLGVTTSFEEIPSETAFPEVAFEHPRDTESAIVRHKGPDGGLVLGYASSGHRLPEPRIEALGGSGAAAAPMAARYVLHQGPRPRPSFGLAAMARAGAPLEPVWFVHRPWRGPIDCPVRPAYLAAVARHQLTAHQVFAVATGRPLSAVVELSRERGHLLEPFGDVEGAAVSKDGLRPVRVDLSEWR